MKQINIDLTKVTNGTLNGGICVYARGWETRYAWGHEAAIREDRFSMREAYARVRYLNRTWESYPLQSVIHNAVAAFVTERLGVSPFKELSEHAKTPRKSAEAEARRLAKIEAVAKARAAYNAICAVIDENRGGAYICETDAYFAA